MVMCFVFSDKPSEENMHFAYALRRENEGSFVLLLSKGNVPSIAETTGTAEDLDCIFRNKRSSKQIAQHLFNHAAADHWNCSDKTTR